MHMPMAYAYAGGYGSNGSPSLLQTSVNPLYFLLKCDLPYQAYVCTSSIQSHDIIMTYVKIYS